MGILVSPEVKGIVLWATASIGRWFLTRGIGRGVFQFRGAYPPRSPLVRALEESGARWEENRGNEEWRRAVAGLTSGGEHTTLSAASLWRWDIKRGMGGRQDSTARMPVGVAEKQFVDHLWTLCQKVLRRSMVPVLGLKRSAPYSRMGEISDVASLWQR